MECKVPVVDARSELGLLATLTVGQGSGLSVGLDAHARSALRAAWRVATRLNGGVPRWPFERHAFTLDVGGRPVRVEGGSLALAAGLAIWALWQGQSLPEGLAATGALGPTGQVRRVGRVAHKLQAAAREGSPRVLCPKGQAVRLEGIAVEEVDTLEDAIDRVGLSRKEVPPDFPDRFTLESQLREVIQHARNGVLGPYRNLGGPPSSVLADRALVLARALEQRLGPNSPLVYEAHIVASESYMRSGDARSAKDVFSKLSKPPDSHEVLERQLKLRKLLLAPDPQVAEVDDAIAELRAVEAPANLKGYMLGTIGRALLHSGRPRDALPILEDAAAYHQKHIPMEAGRSLVYLATALRVLHRFKDATAALDEAITLLEEETRSYCRSYYDQCILYWEYERCRVLLDAAYIRAGGEDPPRRALNDAVEHGLLALGLCDDLGLNGAWPRVGILRLLAWAGYHNAKWQQQLDIVRPLAEANVLTKAVWEEGKEPWADDASIW